MGWDRVLGDTGRIPRASQGLRLSQRLLEPGPVWLLRLPLLPGGRRSGPIGLSGEGGTRRDVAVPLSESRLETYSHRRLKETGTEMNKTERTHGDC